MKITIRRKVFETNSSSTHSISISGKSSRDKSYLSIDPNTNKVKVSFGEFGWGYEKLSSQLEKLSYLITMAFETERYELKSIEDFYNGEGFILLNDEISKYCNCNGIEINDKICEGYIDHQSTEDYSSLKDFLEQNNISVIDYVFDNSIQMIIDNDNH